MPILFVIINFLYMIRIENVKTPIKNFKFDYFGAISLAFIVISFNISFTVIVGGHWLYFGISISIFVVACICFYFSEKHASCGVCPLFILKRPMVEILSLNVLNNMSLYANNFCLPQLLTFFGFSEVYQGVITSLGSAAGIFATMI